MWDKGGDGKMSKLTRDEIMARWDASTSRERDAWVAETVMGWKIGFDPAEDGGASWFTESNGGDWVETDYCPENFKPSTDISAARKVIAAMNSPYLIASTEDGDQSWVHFGNEANAVIGDVAEAICMINYWDEARKLLPLSNCLKRQYACVIVMGGRIISKGWNESLKPCTTCARMDIEHNVGDYAECRAVHAEAMALVKARENSLHGAELYLACADEVDPIPCPTCQKLLDWAGVKQVKEVNP